jgi:hypothetical protein
MTPPERVTLPLWVRISGVGRSLSQLRLLRAGLRSYRAALRCVLADPPDDDIPF